MKRLFVLSALTWMLSLPAYADVVSASKEMIAPASVDRVVRLVDMKKPGSSHLKVSLIVTDSGMSTDVSPRYKVYLGYASYAEMGNITADFKVVDSALRFVSYTRVKPGVYQIKFNQMRADGFYEVVQTIDATQVFSDEQKARQICGTDFCDQELQTTVSVVTDSATKLK